MENFPPSVGYSQAEGLMLAAEEAVEIRGLRRQRKSAKSLGFSLHPCNFSLAGAAS